MPSSPNGPCSSGKTTSTSPSSRGGCPASSTVSARSVRAQRHEHAGAAAVDLRHVAGRELEPLRVVGDEHPAPVLGDADRHHVVGARGRSPAARRPRWRRRRRARRSGRRRRGRRGGGGRRGGALGCGAWSTVLIACDPIARHPAAGARTPALRLACARGPPARPTTSPPPRSWSRPAGSRACPGPGSTRPLELSSTYVADGPVNYARGGNPTWTAFEDALGALEGGAALVFASGMAAIAAALSLAPEGGVVVAPTHAYNGTGAILQDLAAAGRMTVRRVDISDTAAVTEALAGGGPALGRSPRPTRCWRSPTCRPSSRPPTSRARPWSATTPSPPPSASSRSRWGPTSSCTR